jgi:hypothetical protein
MEDMGKTLERRKPRFPQQISVDELDLFAPEPPKIAALQYKGSHLVPFPEELIHEMAPDESCRSGYENALAHLSSP